jgi:hypothetical protein|tara:strand:- start:372 stop:863 length:492 start_codon:yes stop_codon:yes gene_type:complete
MADKNTPSFAVSVTPKVSVDAEAGVFQAMTVIHEDVRKSLGGSGTVDGTGIEALGGTGGSWANGTYTQLTNSSNAGAIANDADSDIVFIKHLGTLVADGTASDNTTTSLLIKHDTDVIAELLNGEAIVLPRCGAASALVLATGDGAGGTSSNHVNVEVFVAGD